MTKPSHTVISSNSLSLCVSTSDQGLGLIYCCCSAFGAGFWNEESLTVYLSSETCSNITSQAARPATSTWNSSSPIKGQETLQRGYLVLLERAQPAELSRCAAAVGWIWFISQPQLPSHLQKRGATFLLLYQEPGWQLSSSGHLQTHPQVLDFYYQEPHDTDERWQEVTSITAQ